MARSLELLELEDDDACEACHMPLVSGDVMPPLWVSILSTRKLCSPSLVKDHDDRDWLKFPCMDMRLISSTKSYHLKFETWTIKHWRQHDILRDENHMFRMYHMVALEHTIAPNHLTHMES